MDSLYIRFKRAGIVVNSHESDLYVKDGPETRRIIAEFKAEGGLLPWDAAGFYLDGQRWIDIAFAFDPFWNRPTPSKEE